MKLLKKLLELLPLFYCLLVLSCNITLLLLLLKKLNKINVNNSKVRLYYI